MIILIILAALGSTIIITRSWLFESVREYFNRWQFTGILFHCPQCMGFWNGLLYAVLFSAEWELIICIALVTSLTGYLFTMLEDIVNRYLNGN